MRKQLKWTIHYAAIESQYKAGSITVQQASQQLIVLIKRIPVDLQDDDLGDIVQDLEDIAKTGYGDLNKTVMDLARWGYEDKGVMVDRWVQKTVRSLSTKMERRNA